jgi:hypothetical protein
MKNLPNSLTERVRLLQQQIDLKAESSSGGFLHSFMLGDLLWIAFLGHLP